MVEAHPAWRARVVYGDTDSLFVLLPGRSRGAAFAIGAEIAAAVTAANPPPVVLKLEKAQAGAHGSAASHLMRCADVCVCSVRRAAIGPACARRCTTPACYWPRSATWASATSPPARRGAAHPDAHPKTIPNPSWPCWPPSSAVQLPWRRPLVLHAVPLPAAMTGGLQTAVPSLEAPACQAAPSFDAKGIETVRRDTCGAVAKMMERSITILFSTKDLSQVLFPPPRLAVRTRARQRGQAVHTPQRAPSHTPARAGEGLRHPPVEQDPGWARVAGRLHLCQGGANRQWSHPRAGSSVRLRGWPSCPLANAGEGPPPAVLLGVARQPGMPRPPNPGRTLQPARDCARRTGCTASAGA